MAGVPRVSRLFASVAESATLAIDAKAKALKAAGEDVVGFGAGEPDFPTPEHIVEAAVAACRDPKNHRYTPTGGLPELREAIAAKTTRDSGLEVAASQILVTNGGKQAVLEAFGSLLDPGDEVLVPAPYWTTYPEAIGLAQGATVAIPTDEATGFRVTLDQLDRVSRSRPSAAGPWSTASGSSPTRSTSTSSTAAAGRRRCRWSCPSWPSTASL
jgi:aspartate/methionine/tyrosine aminotransferase